MNGLIPIVEFMTWNFAMQAVDHIVNSAAKLYMVEVKINIPIIFRGPNGIASRVAAQQSRFFFLVFSYSRPKIVAPFDCNDAKGLLKASINDKTGSFRA